MKKFFLHYKHITYIIFSASYSRFKITRKLEYISVGIKRINTNQVTKINTGLGKKINTDFWNKNPDRFRIRNQHDPSTKINMGPRSKNQHDPSTKKQYFLVCFRSHVDFCYLDRIEYWFRIRVDFCFKHL